MTMYKPGTQLIITDLWAAAAAHKLGFEVESGFPNPAFGEHWVKGVASHRRVGNDGAYYWLDIKKWRITVTESGPNAAERFLPQRNDLIETVNDTHFIVTELLPDDPTWVGNKNQSGIQNPFIECRSIIERNGIPFPQFSEVIEPEKENNNGL